MGTGWLKEEFEILQQPWDRRGARLEEALELMARLWNDPEPSFEGEFFRLPPSAMEPKPLTRPHPPFVFGGITPVALRRAARLGDGWIGVGLGVDDVGPVIQQLHRERDGYGRGDDPFEVALIVGGVPSVDQIAAFDAGGVGQLVVRPWVKNRDAVTNLRAFAADVGLA